jgi:hypothetical protein
MGGGSVTELLSELKEACRRGPAVPDDEVIARGGSTWFRGLPAHAEEGTVGLGLGRDARIIISERDVRAVAKDGDGYSVEISSEANVLLRIEKTLKATVQPDCGCGAHHPGADRTASREANIGLDIGPITICDNVCVDVVVDNGKQSVVYHICIPVNCRVESQTRLE